MPPFSAPTQMPDPYPPTTCAKMSECTCSYTVFFLSVTSGDGRESLHVRQKEPKTCIAPPGSIMMAVAVYLPPSPSRCIHSPYSADDTHYMYKKCLTVRVVQSPGYSRVLCVYTNTVALSSARTFAFLLSCLLSSGFDQ